MISLGSIISPARSPRAGNVEFPILSMTMRNGLIDQGDKFKKRVASENTSAYKIVSRGQLVVGFPIDEGVLSFQKLYDEAIVSPAYAVWDVYRPGVDKNYLERFLRSPIALKFYASKLRSTTARRRSIPQDTFLETPVPLPPLDEQKRIAAILDKADALRAKRRQAIPLLDSLAQSIFLEMFGDPVSNPKGWPMATLGDVIHKASDGPHVSPQYSDEGIPFLSTRHVARGRIIWQDLKHISEEDAKIHWRKCKPERGDVLYTKGGTTGIAAHVDFDEPFAIWVHVALLKTKHDVVSPKWLECMLNGNYCYQQSQTYTHGIANRDLGLKRMVKIKIFLPPLERQVEFLERTNALAHVAKQAELQSTNADSLFASLQHRAFTGQL